MRTFTLLATLSCAALLGACLSNIPEPDIGGVYACEVQEDCPAPLSCLQQTCEAIELPHVEILSPEDLKELPTGTSVTLSISATDLVLRPKNESNEAVPGEGHVVVFIDEVEVETIDSGDLSGGVQITVDIPEIAGPHYLRAQARLNDGTDYDNEDASARRIVFISDGNPHVALRRPWPNDKFSVDSQFVDAVASATDPFVFGPPNMGNFHVHVFYNKEFPACLQDPVCVESYNGVVPSDDDEFGPLLLPTAGAGPAFLTAVLVNPDHTIYDETPNGLPVWSQIEILRSNN